MRKQGVMQVYNALTEKGYNPVVQIVGYILTEDPTYITNYAGARNIISRIDREELLKDIIEAYLKRERGNPPSIAGEYIQTQVFQKKN